MSFDKALLCRIEDVEGLRQCSFPIRLFCLDTKDHISLDLVSSYKIEEVPIDSFGKHQITYRIKLEGDHGFVMPMIMSGVIDNITYDFTCSLRDENNLQYIVTMI